MKKLLIVLAFASSPALSHGMGLTIKKYVPERVTSHDVLLQNRGKNSKCYNVFVDEKPHFNPLVCLEPGGKKYIKVFVDTPPNQKQTTRVCTEPQGNERKAQRFKLCTSVITYYPEAQLQSALQ
ncbi:MAG: hypothetical protein ACRC6V_06620 [Bacteroidales bacterium]